MANSWGSKTDLAWKRDAYYEIGDLATFGGILYQAVSAGLNKPLTSSSWRRAGRGGWLTVTNDGYTILDGDGVEYVRASTGAADRTFVMPTLADNQGREIDFEKTDSGAGDLIMDGEGSEVFLYPPGGTSTTFLVERQYQHCKVRGVTEGWLVISEVVQLATSAYHKWQWTSSLTVANTASTWKDISGDLTINGKAGERWHIYGSPWYQVPNSGFNHMRIASVSGCTVEVDGQSSYQTVGMFLPFHAVILLTADQAVFKIQGWSSNSGGNHIIVAGAGGSANAPFDLIAERMG